MDIEDWVEGARTPLIRPEASRDVAIGSTRASNDEDLEAAHASHYGLPPSTDQAPPRPLYRDLLFALPPALLAMVQNLNSDLILQNFSVKAQVPTSTKALSQLVSGLLSAVLVVVLAQYGDNLHTRWGRRRPIIVVAAIAATITTYFLVYPKVDLSPDNATSAGNYLLVLQLCSALAVDAVSIMYLAWAAELTTSSAARARLFGIFTALSMVVSWIKPAITVSMQLNNMQVIAKLHYLYRVVPAVMLASYFLVCYVEGDRGSVGSTRKLEQAKMSLLPSVRCCTRNKPWLIYMIVQVALDLMQVGMSEIGYVLYYLYQAPVDKLILTGGTLGLIINVAGVAGALSLPLLLKKVTRVKLVGAFIYFLSFAFLVWVGLIFLPPKHHSLVPLYVLVGAVGLGIGAFTASLQVICNDARTLRTIHCDRCILTGMLKFSLRGMALCTRRQVIDYDELLSGRRREAMYKALGNVPTQFISIGMSALPTVTLGVNGISALGNPPAGQASTQALTAMRVWTTQFPCLVLLAAAVVWCKYYPLTPNVFESLQSQVALMKRDRGAALHDPVAGRSFHTLEIVAEGAAPGDKAVSEYLRYFSRRDLLAFAEGWRRRWLFKYCLDFTAFTAFAVAMLAEGAVTFGQPYGHAGLTQDAHRSLAVLQLVVGCGCLFPAAYYALQLTGVRWALRQSKETMRRYVEKLGDIDNVVRTTLRDAASASERGGFTAAVGGGWQRIARHEGVKLGLGVMIVVLLHVLVFESPAAPHCHAKLEYLNPKFGPAMGAIEQECQQLATGEASCLAILAAGVGHVCAWR